MSIEPSVEWEFDDYPEDGEFKCQLTIGGSGDYMEEISDISKNIAWANDMVKTIKNDIQGEEN